MRINLDSNRVSSYITFGDTVSERASSDHPGFIRFSCISTPSNLPGFQRTIPNPQRETIECRADTLEWGANKYAIEYWKSDDHFIGGTLNRLKITISVETIGVVYFYSHGMGNPHEDIMICHSDSSKQLLLSNAYAHLSKVRPFSFDEEKWSKIIAMTQSFSFHNLVGGLSHQWLASRNDLQVIQDHVRLINGKVIQSVVIKNTSNKHYYLGSGLKIGPSWIIYPEGDGRRMEKIEAGGFGRGYHPEMENIKQPFFAPQAEMGFDFEPDAGRICESCLQNRFIGVQVSGSHFTFFDWIFAKPHVYNGQEYAKYHFNEIPNKP